LVPVGAPVPAGTVDPLIYQQTPALSSVSATNELMTVKLRYKPLDSDESKLIAFAVPVRATPIEQASPDLQFAGAVAQFGMLLRESPYKGRSDYDAAFTLAKSGIGEDPEGFRQEFLTLVKQAKGMKRDQTASR